MVGLKRHKQHSMDDEGGQNNSTDRALTDTIQFPLLKLPADIICDILSRLPLKNIIHCKLICKILLELLNSYYFAKIHLARAPILTANLVLQENRAGTVIIHFLTFDLDEAALSSCSSGTIGDIHGYTTHGLRILTNQDADFTYLTSRRTLVGSCNGLICFMEKLTTYTIWNPVLGEFIKLPRITNLAPFSNCAAHSGFGYCPRTKQYKVISIYLTYVESNTSVVARIYTLGSDSWRNIDQNVPWPKKGSFDSLLSGALHWVTNSNKPTELISSFDLETEKFRVIPPPAHFNTEYVNKVSWINIGVLKHCLCICYSYVDTKFEVWVMREYGVKESWMKEFSIDMAFYCNLRVEDLHRPVKFMSNGDLWFISSFNSLFSFNPVKRNFRELRSMGIWKTKVFAHDLGFISLKEVVGARIHDVMRFRADKRTVVD